MESKQKNAIKGRIVSHVGKGMLVEIEETREQLLCQTRRKFTQLAVGDRILCEKTSQDQGLIVELLPRDSILSRPGRQGKSRLVAANLDCVVVVFAVEPTCDFLLIDQYLAFCEVHNLKVILLFNKCDLSDESSLNNDLGIYQELNYPLMKISARTGQGLAELQQALENKTSIFVGQSGVGKSSLTQQLIDHSNDLRTNTLSKGSGHGRHTTTAATLYRMTNTNGYIIDSPGVAIFGLDNFSEAMLAQGFREFRPLVEQCQFNDCRHQNDKGCAIKKALDDNRISSARYQRFVKLIEKLPRECHF